SRNASGPEKTGVMTASTSLGQPPPPCAARGSFSDHDLEGSDQGLRSSDQHLRSSIAQLKSADAHPRSSIAQLKSADAHLRSSIAQWRSADAHLRSSIAHLRSSVQTPRTISRPKTGPPSGIRSGPILTTEAQRTQSQSRGDPGLLPSVSSLCSLRLCGEKSVLQRVSILCASGLSAHQAGRGIWRPC